MSVVFRRVYRVCVQLIYVSTVTQSRQEPETLLNRQGEPPLSSSKARTSKHTAALWPSKATRPAREKRMCVSELTSSARWDHSKQPRARATAASSLEGQRVVHAHLEPHTASNMDMLSHTAVPTDLTVPQAGNETQQERCDMGTGQL